MRIRIIATALLLLTAADESTTPSLAEIERASPPPSVAEAERILGEIDAIYTQAKQAGTIRIVSADGSPTLLLQNLPDHTRTLREQLQAFAISKTWERGDLLLVAWYEAHFLEAILPLVWDVKTYCNPPNYVEGEELCNAIEPEPGRALSKAIHSLPPALPPLPRNISDYSTQPLDLRGAIKQAVLSFEEAASSDTRVKIYGGYMPELSEEVRARVLSDARTKLYELAARAEFMRFSMELREALTNASDAVQLSPALHPRDKSWIGLHLRFVESLLEHLRIWSQC